MLNNTVWTKTAFYCPCRTFLQPFTWNSCLAACRHWTILLMPAFYICLLHFFHEFLKQNKPVYSCHILRKILLYVTNAIRLQSRPGFFGTLCSILGETLMNPMTTFFSTCFFLVILLFGYRWIPASHAHMQDSLSLTVVKSQFRIVSSDHMPTILILINWTDRCWRQHTWSWDSRHYRNIITDNIIS